MRIKNIFIILIAASSLLSGCQAAKSEKIAETTRVAGETQAADVTRIAGEVYATQTALAPTPSPYQAGETRVSPVDGMTMVHVPAGYAIIGSDEGRIAWAGGDGGDDEVPIHTVFHDAFWIDQTEVTNAMFSRFVSQTDYETTPESWQYAYVYRGSKYGWVPERNANWKAPRGEDFTLEGLADHPVVSVSWYDAQAYCQWAGRRLPTEVEWEKAAGGDDGFMFPWGDETSFIDRGNYVGEDDGFTLTAPVISFPAGASPYGVMDLAGNVHEWVFDGYIPYADIDHFTDNFVSLDAAERVHRGGSYRSGYTDGRTASRNSADPLYGWEDLGFRCVLSDIALPEQAIPGDFLPDLMLLNDTFTPYIPSPEGELLGPTGHPTGEKWPLSLEAGFADVVGQYNNCESLKITTPRYPDQPASWILVDTYSTRDFYILYQPCSSFEKILIRPPSGFLYPAILNIMYLDPKDLTGRLQVTNQGEQDTYVALVNADTTNSYGLYLYSGQTETLRGIHDGSYEVYITTGTQWDVTQGRFLDAGLYHKLDDVLKFTQYTTWELVIDVTEGGNAPGSGIDPGEFPPLPE